MLSSDLKAYRPQANGRCPAKTSANVISSNVVANVFGHATSSQRATGLDTDKKIFWGLANTDNLPLLDPETYHNAPTLSPDDYVVKWLSGQRTTEAGLAAELATADLVGTAYLKNNIAADDLTLTVTVKNANLLPGGTYDIFKDGYPIKVCSHSDALATDGAEQIRIIDGTPTYSGLDITITVTEAFTQAFTASSTPYTQSSVRVSSLLQPADVAPSYTTPDVSDVEGSLTLDATTYPPILDNIGTPEQDWSFAFTDGTHFTCTGDTLGVVGSGVIGTDFIPVCPATSRPYMTIEAEMMTGTANPGDVWTMTTHPAGVPVGQRRIIPPLSASLSNNKCTSVFGGEAAA